MNKWLFMVKYACDCLFSLWRPNYDGI